MQCRIAITTKCNLSCEYCCMRTIPEIRNSFKLANIGDILSEPVEFESFIITGGEPFMDVEKTLSAIRSVQKICKPIYLHTNGVLIDITNERHCAILSRVDGLNISIHENNRDLNKYKVIASLLPNVSIKLHVWEKLVDDKLREFLEENPSIKTKIWKLDECSTVPEKRYILID